MAVEARLEVERLGEGLSRQYKLAAVQAPEDLDQHSGYEAITPILPRVRPATLRQRISQGGSPP